MTPLISKIDYQSYLDAHRIISSSDGNYNNRESALRNLLVYNDNKIRKSINKIKSIYKEWKNYNYVKHKVYGLDRYSVAALVPKGEELSIFNRETDITMGGDGKLPYEVMNFGEEVTLDSFYSVDPAYHYGDATWLYTKTGDSLRGIVKPADLVVMKWRGGVQYYNVPLVGIFPSVRELYLYLTSSHYKAGAGSLFNGVHEHQIGLFIQAYVKQRYPMYYTRISVGAGIVETDKHHMELLHQSHGDMMNDKIAPSIIHDVKGNYYNLRERFPDLCPELWDDYNFRTNHVSNYSETTIYGHNKDNTAIYDMSATQEDMYDNQRYGLSGKDSTLSLEIGASSNKKDMHQYLSDKFTINNYVDVEFTDNRGDTIHRYFFLPYMYCTTSRELIDYNTCSYGFMKDITVARPDTEAAINKTVTTHIGQNGLYLSYAQNLYYAQKRDDAPRISDYRYGHDSDNYEVSNSPNRYPKTKFPKGIGTIKKYMLREVYLPYRYQYETDPLALSSAGNELRGTSPHYLSRVQCGYNTYRGVEPYGYLYYMSKLGGFLYDDGTLEETYSETSKRLRGYRTDPNISPLIYPIIYGPSITRLSLGKIHKYNTRIIDTIISRDTEKFRQYNNYPVYRRLFGPKIPGGKDVLYFKSDRHRVDPSYQAINFADRYPYNDRYYYNNTVTIPNTDKDKYLKMGTYIPNKPEFSQHVSGLGTPISFDSAFGEAEGQIGGVFKGYMDNGLYKYLATYTDTVGQKLGMNSSVYINMRPDSISYYMGDTPQ